MVNQELLEYINQQRERGVVDQDLEAQLLKAGWGLEDIKSAMTPGAKLERTKSESIPVFAKEPVRLPVD